MKKVCSWCKKELSQDTFDQNDDAAITHGICNDCVRDLLSYKAKDLSSFLDQFSEPVFLVSSEGRIVTGNNAALSLLRKTRQEIDGNLGGEVFECRYAALPGGCGQTVHCKTCTIRFTVMDTLQTGKSNINVPAYPDLNYVTGENRVRFLISTERVGEAVLLRIGDVAEEKQAGTDTPAASDKPGR